MGISASTAPPAVSPLEALLDAVDVEAVADRLDHGAVGHVGHGAWTTDHDRRDATDFERRPDNGRHVHPTWRGGELAGASYRARAPEAILQPHDVGGRDEEALLDVAEEGGFVGRPGEDEACGARHDRGGVSRLADFTFAADSATLGRRHVLLQDAQGMGDADAAHDAEDGVGCLERLQRGAVSGIGSFGVERQVNGASEAGGRVVTQPGGHAVLGADQKLDRRTGGGGALSLVVVMVVVVRKGLHLDRCLLFVWRGGHLRCQVGLVGDLGDFIDAGAVGGRRSARRVTSRTRGCIRPTLAVVAAQRRRLSRWARVAVVPGRHAERMALPAFAPAEARKIEERVLAGAVVPSPRVDGDVHKVGRSRHGLDRGLLLVLVLRRAESAHVEAAVVQDATDTHGAVKGPKGKRNVQPGLVAVDVAKVRHQVVPAADEHEDGERDVHDQEDLVPARAQRQDGQARRQAKRNGADDAPPVEGHGDLGGVGGGARITGCIVRIGVDNGVHDGLDGGDARGPAVQRQKRGLAPAGERQQQVVAAGKQHGHAQVDEAQRAGAVADKLAQVELRRVPEDVGRKGREGDAAQDNVEHEIDADEQAERAARHIAKAAERWLVVAGDAAQERREADVLLERGPDAGDLQPALKGRERAAQLGKQPAGHDDANRRQVHDHSDGVSISLGESGSIAHLGSSLRVFCVVVLRLGKVALAAVRRGVQIGVDEARRVEPHGRGIELGRRCRRRQAVLVRGPRGVAAQRMRHKTRRLLVRVRVTVRVAVGLDTVRHRLQPRRVARAARVARRAHQHAAHVVAAHVHAVAAHVAGAECRAVEVEGRQRVGACLAAQVLPERDAIADDAGAGLGRHDGDRDKREQRHNGKQP
ncbi:uncharacterized protein SPSK_07046 [Sporothrix schenckii 1099-18]|uniref:Uncharacterized protein n=1 Tax=Sporothrix schenckii 1099-18 TaxID=1397361 RepID=A0A0F2MJ07_SPOSC|nr:uncharacterized protein SPSK_07046 [Sporothrix schenckii 1099-18]KJR88156.1 hypothetical protein SPSK_07046 [Sporothrix schenckii 1099-18]